MSRAQVTVDLADVVEFVIDHDAEPVDDWLDQLAVVLIGMGDADETTTNMKTETRQ